MASDSDSSPDFSTIFWVALVLDVLVAFRSSGIYKRMFGGNKEKEESITAEEKAKHNWLIKIYLLVYLTATLSDWLQGPYVYALYGAYGYTRDEIAILFVAGFGSSTWTAQERERERERETSLIVLIGLDVVVGCVGFFAQSQNPPTCRLWREGRSVFLLCQYVVLTLHHFFFFSFLFTTNNHDI